MKKLKKFKSKIIGACLTLIALTHTYSFADVVSEVNGGGAIQNSKIGQGIMNMVKDITGTLQWILPVVGVTMSLFFLFKIVTGDEQDQQRYKKSIIRVLGCIIAGLVAVTIVNLIAKYFG